METNITSYPESQSTLKIEVYSVLGELIFHQNIINNNYSIDTRNWAGGLYMCKIQSETGLAVQKFIIR